MQAPSSNPRTLLLSALSTAGAMSAPCGPAVAATTDAATLGVLERLALTLEAQLFWTQLFALVGLVALLVTLVAVLWLMRSRSSSAHSAAAAALAASSPAAAPPASEQVPHLDAERWEYLLEGTGHGVWELDPTTGSVVFSPAWPRRLGYSHLDAPRTLAEWRRLIHPDDQAKVRKTFETLLTGALQTAQVIYRMRAKDGDYRWIETSAQLIRAGNGRPRLLFGSNTDISDRRALEEQLDHLLATVRDSESRFRRFFDDARAAMLLIDPSDGRILDANPAACAFYGYTHDEILTLTIHDLTQLASEDVMNEMAQAIASGREQSILPQRRKDGTQRTVEMYMSPHRIDDRLVIFAILHDISERIAAEQALREAATVFESTAEAIVITDTAGVIRRVNPAFVLQTGFEPHEAIGQSLRMLAANRDENGFFTTMWQRLEAQGRWEGELWHRRKNGETFPVWQTISTVRDERGREIGYVVLFTDITQKKRNEEEIAFRANYDALTGLPNRNLLSERLNQALKQARRENSHVAVMFIDLDFFKQVNDTLGHAIGDRLLKLVAERMKMCVRETDTIARLGGDEFVIVLADIDAVTPAGIVAEKLLGQLAEPFFIEGNEIHIGASIGITLYPDDGRDIDTLFRNADLAMYRAKASGRHNVQFFEPAMTTAALDRRALEADLRGALSRRELQLFYLPLIELGSQRIVGVEALLRWQHPQRGLLEPSSFIGLAEESGLIRDIGAWALDEACRQIAQWEAEGHPLLLALNVSLRQLPDALSVKNILVVLKKHGLEPRRLLLEITENALQADTPALRQWFTAAGEAGLNLVIDDFGTGLSSLATLKRYPVRHLKIDKTFIQAMEKDASQRALVEAMLAMAHSLGLSVVAEGVEADSQLKLLRARDCAWVQGYFFGRPLPAAETSALLAKPLTPQ